MRIKKGYENDLVFVTTGLSIAASISWMRVPGLQPLNWMLVGLKVYIVAPTIFIYSHPLQRVRVIHVDFIPLHSLSPKLSRLCAVNARSEAAEAAYRGNMVLDRQPIRAIKLFSPAASSFIQRFAKVCRSWCG